MPFDWEPFQIFLGAAAIAIALYSGGHALLNKSEPRSALGWLVVCVGWPFLGALAYWLFGRNRIQTRAQKLGERFPVEAIDVRSPEDRAISTTVAPEEFAQLARISGAVTGRPLVGGNRITLLRCAEQAYPAMLDAIRSAERSVFLCSYIFDNDRVGGEFVEALAAAAGRGVEVKVLVDGVGECYSMPRISRALAARGVGARRFLPPSLIPPSLNINLRSHRKILAVDGERAFTGGMNISDRHYVAEPRGKRPVVDMHFAVDGPAVDQMEEVFLEDWAFVTGDEHTPSGQAATSEHGDTLCRAVSDGPNEDLNKLKWILLGAISAAEESVQLMTPYFIPDAELVATLNAAALRGIRVEILIPEKLDIPVVGWASRAHLWKLMEFGVEIYLQPPPFVHTKLFIVDRHYATIGSANLDPRSLRLNFEFNLEIYGRDCAAELVEHFVEARDGSRRVSDDEILSRSLPVRLRDSLAFLFSPYL